MERLVGFILLLLCPIVALTQDLVLTGISGPTSFEKYETISMSITVKNDGIVDISQYTAVNVYLSSDNTLDVLTDKYFSYFGIWTLLANESKTLTLTESVPGIAAGNYFLILSFDHQRVITETDESNNIQVLPGYSVVDSDIDLDIQSFTLNTTAVGLHDYMFVNYRIRNTGSSVLDTYVYTGFYLSPDNVLDQSDQLIGNVYADMTGTPQKDVSDRISFPTVTPGAYYVFAKVDDVHTNIQESNESNNTAYVPVNIIPSSIDIDINSTTKPLVLFSNRSVDVNLTSKNNGTTGVINYKADVYLSSDNTLDATDVKITHNPYLMQHFSHYIPASGTINSRLIIQVQNDLAPGNYYVIVKVNPDNSIPETNATNNLAVSSNQITIPPVSYATAIIEGNFIDSDEVPDLQLKLFLKFENRGDAGSFNQDYQVIIRDETNTVRHTQYAFEYFSFFSPFDSKPTVWTINLSEPLPQGFYNVEIKCAGSYNCFTPTSYVPLTIEPKFTLNGNIQGEDGTTISKGKLFLYQKAYNGAVTFIQKIAPTTSDAFSFHVDSREHTLYFVPDPAEYPNYVPTVFGKSVTLKQNSFFKLTNNSTVTFEILKKQILPQGRQTISGYVRDGQTQGLTLKGMNASPLTDGENSYIVMLLTEESLPVGIVRTNADGYYEFNNLPKGIYRILILPDDDDNDAGIPTQESLPVDVTVKNATVDFEITPDGPLATITPISMDQQITIDAFPSKTFGETPFELHASASSELPVTFSSTNPDVASITGNVVTIHAAGETIITVNQSGDDVFNAAPVVSKILTIEKADQHIVFDAIPEKSYGDEAFVIFAIASSNMAVHYSSSNPGVATVSGNTVTITGVGETTLIASQPGNDNFNASLDVTQVLKVSKIGQVITFDVLPVKKFNEKSFDLLATSDSNLPVTFNSSNPLVANIIEGKVIIQGAGTCYIAAHQAGSEIYKAANPIERLLTVEKADQEISFAEIEEKLSDSEDFAIEAEATSSLPVSFSSDNTGVATVVGNVVSINGVGTVNITANQGGNENYAPAKSITRSMTVSMVTGVEIQKKSTKIFPNPTTGIVFFETQGHVDQIIVINMLGQSESLDCSENKIDITNLKAGTYFFKIKKAKNFETYQVVKQ